jgi:hypothetical protein
MIAVDTNLLVYAHRAGVREHRAARRALETAAADARGWGVGVASLAEFWAIVTHASAAGRPSTADEASRFLQNLTDDGNMAIWNPGPGFARRLLQLATDLAVTGARVFDLQIGLTAFDNGAHEIWTHDGHFVRIPGLRVHDPLG